MDLVERDAQLAVLAAALGDAAAGRGSVVLVTGEAGAGKTALVRWFASEAASRSKILWGLCDELVTPRPLGPFRDIAAQFGLAASSGPDMLEAMVAELGGGSYPTVVVVEDAHWADEATVDAIRFIGRRVIRARAVLVVTFRDDEVPADHPLRLAIGAIPPDDVRRVPLEPLSRRAVAELAGRDDVDELYRLTKGNAFYVTELLAAPRAVVPQTVQDAVMARIGRLTAAGRACVETAAVIPGRAERWLLDECGVGGGIDEAARIGILHADGDIVCFSHELARQAVERSLTQLHRRETNGRVLEVLVAHDGDPARLAHHASQAKDADAVARYAPIAARQAAPLGSHREAVAHFEQALRHPEQLPAGEFADLLYEHSYECLVTRRLGRAEEVLNRAVELFSEAGDHERLGASLSALSEVVWTMGRGKDAEEASAEAIAVLEQAAPGSAMAWGYAQHAKLALVGLRVGEAIDWGEKAIGLARRHGTTEYLIHALTTVGAARWRIPPYDNRSLLDGLELARTTGLHDTRTRAYVNLVDGYLDKMDYDAAGRYLEEGLAFFDAHDLLAAYNWLLAHRAQWHLEQGRWDEAEQDARRALGVEDLPTVIARTVLGQLQARRGSDAAAATLDEARQLADRVVNMPTLLGLARLEWSWLRGDLSAMAHTAAEVFELAQKTGSRRFTGEAALWLHRAGGLDDPPPEVMEPFALQMAGRWRRAATLWAELGRPYEQADALGEAPEPAPLLEALEILDQLGARPRAAMVRRRLAEMGVTSIPRGPREATRAHPAGLTERQAEVLRLLADDLTYQEIARRLHLSVKTVDHHVAAVRIKLDVATRADAVAAGRRLGILNDD